jgi:hypothetical protein
MVNVLVARIEAHGAGRCGVARSTKTSLAVRAAALGFALALAALAARLWLGSAPRATSASRTESAETEGSAAPAQPDASVADAPPLHGDISARDQEALRHLLRDAEKARP